MNVINQINRLVGKIRAKCNHFINHFINDFRIDPLDAICCMVMKIEIVLLCIILFILIADMLYDMFV